MKAPLVLIEWVDSSTHPARWAFLDECKIPKRGKTIYSTGFLIGDKKKAKTLAANIGRGTVLGLITIPTRCILRINTLKEAKRK